MAEQLQILDESRSSLAAALDAEGNEASVATREDSVRDRLVGTRLEARIADPGRAPVRLEVLGDGERIGAMALDPERQRLQPLQEEEGVEGREGGACVSKQDGPHSTDVGGRLERLRPDDSVVGRIRLGQ